jgi:hypothetical protein
MNQIGIYDIMSEKYSVSAWDWRMDLTCKFFWRTIVLFFNYWKTENDFAANIWKNLQLVTGK